MAAPFSKTASAPSRKRTFDDDLGREYKVCVRALSGTVAVGIPSERRRFTDCCNNVEYPSCGEEGSMKITWKYRFESAACDSMASTTRLDPYTKTVLSSRMNGSACLEICDRNDFVRLTNSFDWVIK